MERPNIYEQEKGRDYTELLALIQRAEEISDSQTLSREEIIFESKIIVKELLAHLQSDLHLELSGDVTALYNEMSRENILARVEDIVKVIKCITTGQPIAVGSSSNKHSANSVTSDPEGLRIAMAEAGVTGPIRLLVGLDVKTLIGFKNDHLQVSEIGKDEFDIRDTELRSAYCRYVSGEIRKEDIRYLIMRIPRKMFPEEKMSEEELVQQGNFIFRGVEIDFNAEAEENISQAA